MARKNPVHSYRHNIFFFAVGCNIPSIVIAPFLTEKDTLSESNNIGSSSRIFIAYTILGGITTVALLFQVFLFTFYRYYTPPMYVTEISNDSCEGQPNAPENGDLEDSSIILGINVRKLKLVIITVLFLGTYQGMEVCTMQFVPIFGQYSELKMTESASAYVLTGLTGMFAIGRGIGLVIIFKVLPEIILCLNGALIILSNLILLLWASNNLTMFWIGCLLLGTGFSTMYPSFCAFMEKHLVFTNAVCALICVFGSTVASTYPLIVGNLIEQKAVVLTYTNFFSMIICVLAMLWGFLLSRKRRVRV